MQEENLIYDEEVEALNTDLNLDLSVISEKSSYSTSSLDKVGIKVFADETDWAVKMYDAKQKKEYKYYKKNIFVPATSSEDKIIANIKSKVFTAESIAWEYKDIQKPTENNRTYMVFPILTLGLVLLIIIYKIQFGRRKKKVADSEYSNA